MLNLLITIIGQSFQDIKDNANYANFKERAKIITENSYLEKCFKCLLKTEDTDHSPFVMIIKDIRNESEILTQD